MVCCGGCDQTERIVPVLSMMQTAAMWHPCGGETMNLVLVLLLGMWLKLDGEAA